jgi:hypothetical protein
MLPWPLLLSWLLLGVEVEVEADPPLPPGLLVLVQPLDPPNVLLLLLLLLLPPPPPPPPPPPEKKPPMPDCNHAPESPWLRKFSCVAAAEFVFCQSKLHRHNNNQQNANLA